MLRRLIGWAGPRRSDNASAVLLAESAEVAMRAAAARAHPRETGGILLGVWTEGRPWVTHAQEVFSGDAGPTHYVLPRGATRPIVDEIHGLDSRIGYLGDWHTHPIDVTASSVDRQTARLVAANSEPDNGPVVLLVARRRGTGYIVDAHVAEPHRVRIVPLIRTGDLS